MAKKDFKKGRKVFVAMSGGVDSSVATLLLKKAGYDTTGVFMVNWKGGCEWKEDKRDAMRVCAKLRIPFLTFDFEKEYKKEVIDYMTREYMEGKTPNPDVMCNRRIKFGVFLKQAIEMGADYIATGHYIRISHSQNSDKFPISNFQFPNKTQNPKPKFQTNPKSTLPYKRQNYKLLQAKDKNKDQSYFLWTLTQEELKHCLFPIGDYLKPEVREIAKKAGLITADKKDSQGLCFVGKVRFDDFLKTLMKKNFPAGARNCEKGPIYDLQKNKIGEHKGLCYYTIGQRSGLGIGGRPDAEETGGSAALYVAEKKEQENALIVAPQENSLLYKKELCAKNLNWVNGSFPIGLTYGVRARIRYRQPLQKCKIYAQKNGAIKVVFDTPQRAVAPGQSIVFYKEEEMLGGGVIC